MVMFQVLHRMSSGFYALPKGSPMLVLFDRVARMGSFFPTQVSPTL